MKSIYALLLYFLITIGSFGQTWLVPKPSFTISPNQSYHFSTTNLFINSFYLGGSNGVSGYFIWNGVRINSLADLTVAVSNSVAPSNFVLKVDFTQFASNSISSDNVLSNMLVQEIAERTSNDTAFANQITFVPTNLIINYEDSSTNFITWTNSGKDWFLNVCLTNGQGAGGIGSLTNIVYNYITNITTVSNSYINILEAPVNNVTNLFSPTINNTNNITVGSTTVNNTNIFVITNVFGQTFVVTNFNTVNNTINNTNNITVGSTTVNNTNIFVITNVFGQTFVVTNINNTTINTTNINNNTITGVQVNATINNSNNVVITGLQVNANNTINNTNTVIVTNIITETVYVTNTIVVTNAVNVSNTFQNVQGDTFISNNIPISVAATVNVSGITIENIIQTQTVDVTSSDGSITITGTGPFDLRVTNATPRMLISTNGTTLGVATNLDFSYHYSVSLDNGIAYVSNTPPSIQVSNVPTFAQAQSKGIGGLVLGIYDDGPATQQISEIDFSVLDPTVSLLPLYTEATNFITGATGTVGRFNEDGSMLKGALLKLEGQTGYFPVYDVTNIGTNTDEVTLSKAAPANATSTIVAAYGMNTDYGVGLRTTKADVSTGTRLWPIDDRWEAYHMISAIPITTNIFLLGNYNVRDYANTRWRVLECLASNKFRSVRWMSGGYSCGSHAQWCAAVNKIYSVRGRYSTPGYYNVTDFNGITDLAFYVTNVPTGNFNIGPNQDFFYIASSEDGNALMLSPETGFLQVSVDGGVTFSNKTVAGSRTWRSAAAKDTNTMVATYTLSSVAYFMKTTNNWASIAVSNAPQTNFAVSVASFTDMASDGTNIIMCGNGGQLFISRDFGNTWSISYYNSRYSYVDYAKGVWTFSGSSTAASGQPSGSDQASILVSTDAFISVSAEYTTTTAGTPDDYSGLSMAVSDDGRYVFTSYAASDYLWRYDRAANLGLSVFAVSQGDIQELYCGPRGYVSVGYINSYNYTPYYSIDNGDSWVTHKNWNGQPLLGASSVVAAGTNAMYRTFATKPYYSVNVYGAVIAQATRDAPTQWVTRNIYGADWFSVSISRRSIMNSVFSDGKLYTGLILGGSDGNAILESEDSGSSFKISNQRFLNVTYSSDGLNDATAHQYPIEACSNVVWSAFKKRVDTVLTGGGYDDASYTDLYKYENLYTSSQLVTSVRAEETIGAICTLDNQTVWVANATNVLVSYDGGLNFAAPSSDLASRGSVTGIATLDNTNLYATTWTNALWYSSNGGTNWSTVILNTQQWMGVTMVSTNHVVAYTRDNRYWETKDGGLNWTEYIQAGITYTWHIDSDKNDTNRFVRTVFPQQIQIATNGINGSWATIPASTISGTRNTTAFCDVQAKSTITVDPRDDRVVKVYIYGNAASQCEWLETFDGGLTWRYHPNMLANVQSVKTKDGIVYTASTSQTTPSRISYDEGNTWQPLDIGLATASAGNFSFNNYMNLYALVPDPMEAGYFWYVEYNGSSGRMSYYGNRSYYTNYAAAQATWTATSWDAITDTLSTLYNYGAIYFMFSFDNTNHLEVLRGGSWAGSVTNDAGSWKYWDGDSYEPTISQSLDEAIKNAATYTANQMDYGDVTGVTESKWFERLPLTNLTVTVVMKAGSQQPILEDFSFVSNYKAGTITRENDQDYEVAISTNHTSTVTRKQAGTVNAKIYYMEVIP